MPRSTLIADRTQIAKYAEKCGLSAKMLQESLGTSMRTIRSLWIMDVKKREKQEPSPFDEEVFQNLAAVFSQLGHETVTEHDLTFVTLDREAFLKHAAFKKKTTKAILEYANATTRTLHEYPLTDVLAKALANNQATLTMSHGLWSAFADAFDCRPAELLSKHQPHRKHKLLERLKTEIIPDWFSYAITHQDQSGGFYVGFKSSIDSRTRITQPWASAQMVVAMLSYPSTAIRHQEVLKQSFRYFQERRLQLPATNRRQEEHGWGLYENHHFAGTEQTAWVILAHSFLLNRFSELALQGIVSTHSLIEEARLITQRQCTDSSDLSYGAFCPTSVVNKANARTYSTVMALWALAEVARHQEIGEYQKEWMFKVIRDGVDWLLKTPNKVLNYEPNPTWVRGVRTTSEASYPGLTAQVIYTLLEIQSVFPEIESITEFKKTLRKLLDQFIATSIRLMPSIDFTSAHANLGIDSVDQFLEGDYVQLEGSTFFYLPWAAGVLSHLQRNPNQVQLRWRSYIEHLLHEVVAKLHDILVDDFNRPSTSKILLMCSLGETLFGLSHLVQENKPNRKFSYDQLENIYANHPVRAELVLQGVPNPHKLTVEDLSNENKGHISDQNHLGGVDAVLTLASKVKVSKNSQVLDVGCGIGGSARVLAQKYGCHVTGVELTRCRYQDAVNLTKMVGLESQVSYLLGDFLELDFANQKFNVIWSQGSWVHFDDLEVAIKKAVGLLKPKGRLAIEDAFLKRAPVTKQEKAQIASLEASWAATLRTRQEWTKSITDSDCKVVYMDDLTPAFLDDLSGIRARYLKNEQASLNHKELEGIERGIQMLKAGILGYMSLVAVKS